MLTKFPVHAVLAAVLTVPAMAQDDLKAKGIFIDSSEDRQTAMKFNVLLERNGARRRVPSNYKFVDGDRMKFEFELNRDAYVYVLHRTIAGEPDRLQRYAGPAGIEIIRDDDRRSNEPSRYQVLFPAAKTGRANRLASRKVHAVPTGEVYFNMDDKPGIEKLFVIVSDTPIDIARWPGVAGEVGSSSGGGSRRSNRDDSDDDVTSRLKQYSENTSMAFSKGLNVVEGYGIGIDRSKPMVFQIDLNHHRR